VLKLSSSSWPCVEIFMREESTIRRWVAIAKDMNSDLAMHIEQYPWIPMAWIVSNKYIVGIGATSGDKLTTDYAKIAFDLANEKYLAGYCVFVYTLPCPPSANEIVSWPCVVNAPDQF
jgi:hypothetical protein